MNSEELRDLAYGEFLFAWVTTTPFIRGAEMYSRSGTIAFKARTKHWFYNGLIRREHSLPVDEAIELAEEFLSDRDYKVIAREWEDSDLFEAALKIDGAEESDHSVSLMVLRSRLPEVNSDLRMDIEGSDTAKEAWRRIAIDVFSEDDKEWEEPLEMILREEDGFMYPSSLICVAYENDTPVCIGQLRFSHGIAGIYWVATAKDKRHKGHATALTTYLVNLAFDRGAQAVTLQASGAEPVYEAMGFKTVGKLKVVVVKR